MKILEIKKERKEKTIFSFYVLSITKFFLYTLSFNSQPTSPTHNFYLILQTYTQKNTQTRFLLTKQYSSCDY